MAHGLLYHSPLDSRLIKKKKGHSFAPSRVAHKTQTRNPEPDTRNWVCAGTGITLSENGFPPPQVDPRSTQRYSKGLRMKRELDSKLSSNEFSYTNSLLLLVKNMLCSKLDRQKGFNLILFLFKILRSSAPENRLPYPYQPPYVTSKLCRSWDYLERIRNSASG